MYSVWITLPKPQVAEKSVASFTDQRTLMRKKTPKTKESPSYPHTRGRMGAMARDCPIGVEVGMLKSIVQ